jgi:hypothetical protein
MSRTQYIKELLAQGLSKEQIIEELKKGNEEKGVKPVKGKDEKEVQQFANLIYNKTVKKQ